MADNKWVSVESRCRACEGMNITVLIEIPRMPIHCNLLWSTREEAIQAPRGDIRLGFCSDCGHIFNLVFKPELMEYVGAYENSLHFSPRFQRYAKALATQLVERHDLYNKVIIEIGCGQGEFLKLLCDLGNNRGVGFDPSYIPEQEAEATGERIGFIQDFYSECYAGYQADLICCRHVLEHIELPRDFLGVVRHAIGDRLGTAVFFEVPNAMFTLKGEGIWDLIYEHPSYFSVTSLSHLFTLCGFKVCDLTEVYGGQFLCIEALPADGRAHLPSIPGHNLEVMSALVVAFTDQYRSKVNAWQLHLERIADTRQRAVVWGGGSKGVTFLNTLKAQDQITYVVDINPRKQGMYVAGTGQKIVSPEFLYGYQPDVVIVMNPVYASEIRQLADRLGLAPEFLVA